MPKYLLGLKMCTKTLLKNKSLCQDLKKNQVEHKKNTLNILVLGKNK